MLHHCPDLSAYVAEETNLLKEEIAALGRVSIKLELEIRQTMDITGKYFVEKKKRSYNDFLHLK